MKEIRKKNVYRGAEAANELYQTVLIPTKSIHSLLPLSIAQRWSQGARQYVDTTIRRLMLWSQDGFCLVGGWLSAYSVMPNTHCRRRRDATVELSRVGGVYWALLSRDKGYRSDIITLRHTRVEWAYTVTVYKTGRHYSVGLRLFRRQMLTGFHIIFSPALSQWICNNAEHTFLHSKKAKQQRVWWCFGYRTLRHQDTLGHFGAELKTLRHECHDGWKAGTLRPRTIPMRHSSTGDSA